MDQNTILKPAAFGGFDKKSVLDFIDDLTAKNQQAQDALNKKISDFAKAQDSQLAHIQTLKNELAQREEELSTLRQSGRGAAVSEESGALAEENAKLKNRLEQMEIAYNDAKQQLLHQSQTAAAPAADKDDMMRKIADTMVTATANAEKLVEDAKSEAEQTRSKARSEAHDILSDAQAKADNLREDSQKRADEIMEQALTRDMTSLEKTKASIDRLKEDAVTQLRACYDVLPGLKSDCAALETQVENAMYSLRARIKDLQSALRQMEENRPALLEGGELPDDLQWQEEDEEADDSEGTYVVDENGSFVLKSRQEEEQQASAAAVSEQKEPEQKSEEGLQQGSAVKPVEDLNAVMAKFVGYSGNTGDAADKGFSFGKNEHIF